MAGSSGEIDAQKVARTAAVLQAISDFDLTSSQAWDELDALSSRTYIDDLEVDPEGIIIDGDQFKGVMNVYVLLHYGGSGEDAFQTSDAFRAQFEGHFGGTTAYIDTVTVDTSPFFAGETA